MRTAEIIVFMYPEIPKFSIKSGVIKPMVTTIPRRKTRGEKEQVHKAMKAVIQKTIKPLKAKPTLTVKIASARITVSST